MNFLNYINFYYWHYIIFEYVTLGLTYWEKIQNDKQKFQNKNKWSFSWRNCQESNYYGRLEDVIVLNYQEANGYFYAQLPIINRIMGVMIIGNLVIKLWNLSTRNNEVQKNANLVQKKWYNFSLSMQLRHWRARYLLFGMPVEVQIFVDQRNFAELNEFVCHEFFVCVLFIFIPLK